MTLYQSATSQYKDDPRTSVQTALAEMLQSKESIELELQRSVKHLDTTDGIRVNIIPDYKINL